MQPKAKKAKAKDEKRVNIRFKPDLESFAFIELNPGTGEFSPAFAGLLLNESYNGCALAIANTPDLKAGDQIRIKVGHMAPLKAEIRWRTDLDEEVIKLGVMYLE